MTNHTDFINRLQVDSTPIHEDDQSLKVYVEVEDGAGVSVRIRVDLRWVSLEQAVNAAGNTFLEDVIFDHFGEHGYSDILCTRSARGEIVFIAFSLTSSFLAPRRRADFPG